MPPYNSIIFLSFSLRDLTEENTEEVILFLPQNLERFASDKYDMISWQINFLFLNKASLILLLPISTINFKKLNFIKSTKKRLYYMD